MRKRIKILGLMLLLSVLLSGCFFRSVDELYCLPQQSEEYNDLQTAINLALSQNNANYSGPISGSNQQAVQLVDLDGDGTDEAIAFLKAAGDNPLKIAIFKRTGENYENVATIENAGSAFSSVEYLQLDDKPGMEILVGRQVGDQVLQSLGAYTLQENHIVELMSTNYSEYTTADLDNNGLSEVVVLRFDSEEHTGVVERFCYRDGQLERDPEVLMSTSIGSIKRIITGKLQENVPAVFVASLYEESSVLTDIFALRNGCLANITALAETGTAAETVRNYFVYATDIDGDGLMELPRPELLSSYGTEGENYWTITWYNMTLNGETVDKMTTYHNYSSGWYVVLPDAWKGHLIVTRGNEASGVLGYVFSHWENNEEAPEELFTIYEFSGIDRNTLAEADGRFSLGERGDITYAAHLAETGWAASVTKTDLADWFRFIYVDWNTGEVQ